MIISTAPSRISLFGGGTDLPDFSDKYGGRVLNMSINLRHVCRIVLSHDMSHHITAMDEQRVLLGNIPPKHFDPKFDLIYHIMRRYANLPFIEFIDTFDGIQSAGLGSSASAAVSMIAGLNRLMKKDETVGEIAHKAWRAEIDLGWISGKQDQYAAAYGGLNLMEFENGSVWVDPLPRNIALEFTKWCVLLFTGKTRHSSEIQKTLKSTNNVDALLEMRGQTWVARDLLSRGDYEGVGKLLKKTWELKKASNPAATSEQIDVMFDRAYKFGALGGKMLGAGGDGCVVFIIDPHKRDRFISDMGLKHLDFSVSFDGVEVREI